MDSDVLHSPHGHLEDDIALSDASGSAEPTPTSLEYGNGQLDAPRSPSETAISPMDGRQNGGSSSNGDAAGGPTADEGEPGLLSVVNGGAAEDGRRLASPGSSSEGLVEALTAGSQRMVRRASSAASSSGAPAAPTPSSNSLKASTSRKRKLGGGGSGQLSGSQSRASTPAPPDDSTLLAATPVLVNTSVPNFFTTRNHPMNKATFRYSPCGPSPNSREGCPLYRNIPSPPANTVHFSWEDRSTYVSISADASAITTEKGFRGARANVPLREGAWYFEVVVEPPGAGSVQAAGSAGKGDGQGPHVRIGLGRREAGLNAPVGFDGYSYSIRDKTGDKVHLSVPKAYGRAFGVGDVIGVYISLPPREGAKQVLTAADEAYQLDPDNPARIVRKRVPIRFKGQLYFESMEFVPSKEMEDLAYATKDPMGFAKSQAEALAKQQQKAAPPPPGRKKAPPPPTPPPPRPLPTLAGSKIAFFVNGECQGLAFEDLLDWLPLRPHAKKVVPPSNARVSMNAAIALAREHLHDDGSLGYYPMVSVFGGGVARLQAGPDFRFPPPNDIEAHLVGPATSTPSAAGEARLDGSDFIARHWRPLSERHAEYFAEQRAWDEIDDQQALEAARAKAEQEVKPEPVLSDLDTLAQYASSLPPVVPTLGSPPLGPSGHGGSVTHTPTSVGGTKHLHSAKKKTALSNELELVSQRQASDGGENVEEDGSGEEVDPSEWEDYAQRNGDLAIKMELDS